MRQFFDFFRFLHYVEGEDVLVCFVDVVLEFGGQFEELFGVSP